MSAYLTKYVGSKLWLVDSMPDRLPMPDPGGAIAVPFVGGGSVVAHYGARGVRVIASDTNARLVNAHVQVQRDVDLVIGSLNWIVAAWRKALEDAAPPERDGVGRIFFEEHRTALTTSDGGPSGYKHDAFAAARFLFIVRAGFNGLWRENGDGVCNVAYGKPKLTRDLVGAEKLRAYAAAIQGVEFLCEDFAVTCARALPGWGVYLDPPYSGTFTGYCGGDWEDRPPSLPGLGKPTDRERLAAMLTYLEAIGAHWTLSDADTPTTRRLYASRQVEMVSRSGTVSCDGDGREDVPEILCRNWQSRKAAA